MKKAQFEAIGLSMIVLIIVLALLFAFKFSSSGKNTSPKQDFAAEELSSSMLSSLLRTSTACRDLNIEELIADQENAVKLNCTVGDPISLNTTIFLNNVLDSIFSKTFDVWNREYEFYAKNDTDVFVAKKSGVCLKKTSATYFIPAASLIEIRLSICS